MALDDRIKGLIAVGASITANCQPCLQKSIGWAQENGAGETDIDEAISVGKFVRRGAALKMDDFSANLNAAVVLTQANVQEECNCK